MKHGLLINNNLRENQHFRWLKIFLNSIYNNSLFYIKRIKSNKMIKQSLVTIIACVISMGATAQDKLLAEYNNEIELFYKTIKGNKMLIQPLVDRSLKVKH